MKPKHLLGNIEYSTVSLIAGWVESLTAECHELFCVDCDVSIFKFYPDLPRPDVEEVHTKRSLAGFQIRLSRQIAMTHSGHRFDVRQGNNHLTTGMNRFAEQSSEGLLYVYVCELFDYLISQRHVSGIQRYVLDVLEELYNSSQNSDVKIISFDPGSQEFYEVTKLHLEQLHLEYTSGRTLDQVSKRIIDQARFDLAHIRKGDCLISLGALWGVPGAYAAIQKLIERGVCFIPFIYDLIPALPDQMHTSDNGVVQGFARYLNFCCRFASSIGFLSMQTKADFDNWSEKYFAVTIPGSVIGAIPRDSQTRGPQSELSLDLPPNSYILQVGTLEPRKRHLLTIQTFLSIIDSNQESDLKLVLVGRKGWRMDHDWAAIEDAIHTGRVVLYEDVDDQYLNELYSNARFTVFPSTYEGWGLPISESLVAGVPCLAPGKGAMLEAGGEFATYFRDDSDFEELFKKLSLDDSFLVEERKRASRYDLGAISSPLTNLISLARSSASKFRTRTPIVRLSKEYCFRSPATISADGGQASEASPFFAGIPSLTSKIESLNLVVSYHQDPTIVWLTSDSELSFRTESNEELWVLIAANIESFGILKITANNSSVNYFVNAGINLISFCAMPSPSGELRLKFRCQNRKVDSRSLELGIDSLLVTKVTDAKTRELSLHHWINSGKQLAEHYQNR